MCRYAGCTCCTDAADEENTGDYKEGNNANIMKREAGKPPVLFRVSRRAKGVAKAEGDLGLSGPVVAAYESYWPAKSQVILSEGSDRRVHMCASSFDDGSDGLCISSARTKIPKANVGFVVAELGFLCGMCLASKMQCPSKSQKCPTLVNVIESISGSLR